VTEDKEPRTIGDLKAQLREAIDATAISDSEVYELLFQIAAEEALQDGMGGILDAVEEAADVLLDKNPCLSEDQAHALSIDFSALLKRLGGDRTGLLHSVWRKHEVAATIAEISNGSFPFSLKEIPSDIRPFFLEEMERAIEGVVSEAFGWVLAGVSQQERFRLEWALEKAIKQAASDLAEERKQATLPLWSG